MQLPVPRPYSGLADLEKMQNILAEGRRAANGTYYPHIGDLNWWLFYPPIEFERWQHIFLWDDPSAAEHLLGWVLLSPDGFIFDVYTQPGLRGTSQAEAMYLWAEEQITALAQAGGESKISVGWIDQEDRLLQDRLAARGFQVKSWDVHLSLSLEDPIPEVELPAGFHARGCRGIPEVEARATAQRLAFGTQIPFEPYLQRWRRFMQSPVYNPDLDVVIEAPDGRIASFCIIWLDPLNRVGHFEPVGTHPDFQRRGLGKAVMREGLRRLKKHAMLQAEVFTLEGYQQAVGMYLAAGFRLAGRLANLSKKIA